MNLAKGRNMITSKNTKLKTNNNNGIVTNKDQDQVNYK